MSAVPMNAAWFAHVFCSWSLAHMLRLGWLNQKNAQRVETSFCLWHGIFGGLKKCRTRSNTLLCAAGTVEESETEHSVNAEESKDKKRNEEEQHVLFTLELLSFTSCASISPCELRSIARVWSFVFSWYSEIIILCFLSFQKQCVHWVVVTTNARLSLCCCQLPIHMAECQALTH